jgi:hypothetical protein
MVRPYPQDPRLRGRDGRCRDRSAWYEYGTGHALERGREPVRVVLDGVEDSGLPPRDRFHLHLVGLDAFLLLPHTGTLRYHVPDNGRLY